MHSNLNAALDRVRDPRVRRIATVGAWLFILTSVTQLLPAVVKMGNPGAVTRIFGHGAWGLTYVGTLGATQALAQIAVVLAAAACTLPPLRRSSRLRRWALVLLSVWAGWWGFNVASQLGAEPTALTFLQLVAFVGLLGCTILRSVRLWSMPAASAIATPELLLDDEDDLLGSEHVTGSARVREIGGGRFDERVAQARSALASTGRRAFAQIRPHLIGLWRRLRSAPAALRARAAASGRIAGTDQAAP